MSHEPNIEVVEAKLLPGVVADEIVATIQDTLQDRDFCSIALAGGRTPGAIYRSLSRPPRVGEVEWEKVKLFSGDERWLPANHSHSNQLMVNQTLLSALPAKGPKFFAINCELKSADAAAKVYEEQLRVELGAAAGEVPELDLVLLGIGEDGHTASIYRDSPVLKDPKRLCMAVKEPDSDVERVTLTPTVFFNARKVIFIARGEGKADILRRVLTEEPSPSELPARLFTTAKNPVTWFLDSSAAVKLKL